MPVRMSVAPRRVLWAILALLTGVSASVTACGSPTHRDVSLSAAPTIPTVGSPANTTTTINVPPPTSKASRTAASGGSVPSGNPGAAEEPTTTTSVPCSLSGRSVPSQIVPIDQVCSSVGTPHFDTPQAAMTYLASAWNAGDVQEIDYVTDPNGRQELDSMASVMVNLRFETCSPNPSGDYTCYFMHDIKASTSRTTYPNPMNYPPGEAVFTVAPAEAPGWYLTNVIHCG
jgi:hypothetical protein